MTRRRRKADPLFERRRRHLLQGVGLFLLVAVAIVLVVMALQVP